MYIILFICICVITNINGLRKVIGSLLGGPCIKYGVKQLKNLFLHTLLKTLIVSWGKIIFALSKESLQGLFSKWVIVQNIYSQNIFQQIYIFLCIKTIVFQGNYHLDALK